MLCLVLFVPQRSTYFEKKHTAQMLTSRFLRVYPAHDWTQPALITQQYLSILTHIVFFLSAINSISSSILTSSVSIFKLNEIKQDSNGVWRCTLNICTESALTFWDLSATCTTSLASKPSPDCMFIHQLCLSTVVYWLGNSVSAFHLGRRMSSFQENSEKNPVAFWD